MDLGVAVLASLGGRHINDLARAVLDHDEAVLPQGRALHGEGGRRTGICRIEVKGMLMLSRPIVSIVLSCPIQHAGASRDGDGSKFDVEGDSMRRRMVGRVCGVLCSG